MADLVRIATMPVGFTYDAPFRVSQYTGKERDSESGLDNFGARFDSSTIGRFMSPDPLLNSGRPWLPQTWNRYSYARNNPLNLVDPSGLYDLANNCGPDDKRCNKQFRQHADDLKKGLSDLQKKVDKMKDSPEKDRLETALRVLGTEGDHNDVNVTFGALNGTAAAETNFQNPESGPASATITFDPSKNGSSSEYAISAAHEGTHIEDDITGSLQAYTENALSTPNWLRSPQLSPFSLEYRGYQTSAWAAQALGMPALSYQGVEIWNSSWRAADRQTLMDRRITQHVTSIPGHPETMPHNPWPN